MEQRINVVIRLSDGNVAIVYRDLRVVIVDRAGLVTRERPGKTAHSARTSARIPPSRLH